MVTASSDRLDCIADVDLDALPKSAIDKIGTYLGKDWQYKAKELRVCRTRFGWKVEVTRSLRVGAALSIIVSDDGQMDIINGL
jgi:hypothetical protein